MTAIERTAYPRLKPSRYQKEELRHFEPTPEEVALLTQYDIRGDQMRLNFLLQLKSYQALHHFINVSTLPLSIVDHVKKCLNVDLDLKPQYSHSQAQSRHRNLIRQFLELSDDHIKRKAVIETAATEISGTENDPADIINHVVAILIEQQFELPAFSTLVRTVRHIRYHINNHLFEKITERLRSARKLTQLLATLEQADDFNKTPFHEFKAIPTKPTVTGFRWLNQHHEWLMSFGDMQPYLKGISKIKLSQFAEEAKSLDASLIKSFPNINKRYALVACLLAQAQQQAKDALVKTFTLSIESTQKEAEQRYTGDIKHRQNLLSQLIEFVFNMTTGYEKKQAKTKKVVEHIHESYQQYGGTEKVIEDCEKILAKPSTKHFPYFWKPYTSHRRNMLAFLNNVPLKAIKQKQYLLDALTLVKELYDIKFMDTYYTPETKLDLSWLPKRFQKIVFNKSSEAIHVQYFELCVMLQIAEELGNGDLYVKGADEYANYRDDILSARNCQPLMLPFCEASNIPRNKKQAVAQLKKRLINKIHQVNRDYPKIKEFVIDNNGTPSLKKRVKVESLHIKQLHQEIKKRMPKRNLLDVMTLAQQYTEWTHCFSPISGNESKLQDAIAANIITTFCYGTSMGPTETERHVKSKINAKTIAAVNKSHVTLTKLNKALAKIINYYKVFPLVNAWGTGEAVSVDGTLVPIYEQNLFSELHFRYGKRGAIAYHHISDTYIALFSSLIPCGVWEAVAIIDGLLKNESSIKPGRIHGDTQSQSMTVFALTYLFGIKLMPRIRHWKDLTFYKPVPRMRLKNIGSLFKGDVINWQLIEDNCVLPVSMNESSLQYAVK